MSVTLKIGGFLFPSKPHTGKVKAYVDMLNRLVKSGRRLLVVTGGGEMARRYIQVAREEGVDEAACDQIGIDVSRLNAYLLISLLGEAAYHAVPVNVKELKQFFQLKKIVVMGGLTPGHSTTAVGAICAEAVKANCYIIASDVDGIYTADPKIDKSAKKLDKATTSQVLKIAAESRLVAGSYQLDLVALKVIERSKIPTFFLDGRDPSNVERAVMGKKVGTRIIAD